MSNYLQQSIKIILNNPRNQPVFNMNVLENLTKREYEIARDISLGWSEKEIADRNFISYDTVHAHAYNIRKKLDARSAVDVARKFILNLENPKAYFITVTLIVIQAFMIFNIYTYQARRVSRTSSRTARTSRVQRIYNAG